MKLLVLGAGATGGYFGGRLAQAAQLGKSDIEVDFLVRPRRADALRAQGLKVVSPQGDFTIPVNAVLHTELKPVYDLVLLSCKAWDLESSILSIYPGLTPDTAILPVLNGLAHFDRLDAEFGAGRVLGGCCHIGGNLGPDGVVRQMTDLQRITFGLRPRNDRSQQARLDALATAYRATPVDVRASDDVDQDLWEKFVLLASLAAMTCLMRANVGDIVSTDDGEHLMRAVYAECEAAARHANHAPRAAARDATLATLTQRGSNFTASMLRDLESGGNIEAAHIVGDMRARARAAGDPAPLLSVAWAHLQARDARRARENG
ncbi:MAG: 2-dehydropantoate 2-reductase [Burkholderiales bacterium]|nr:2-dehydropantoate 2-reductase [Burkholderiales bacterium]